MNEHGAQENQGIQTKTCPSVTLTTNRNGLAWGQIQDKWWQALNYIMSQVSKVHCMCTCACLCVCVCVHTYVCVTCRTKCVHLQYFCKVSIMKRMLSRHVKKKPCVKEKYSKQTENIKFTGSVLDRKKTWKCYVFSWRETAWHYTWKAASPRKSWCQLALQSGVLKTSAYRTTKLSELQHIKLESH